MDNKISYILSADEVKEILFASRVLKPYKTKVIIFAVLSLIFIVLTFVPKEPTTYSIIVALLFANLFAFYGYKKHEENTVKGSTTGEVTELIAYDEYINVIVKEYEADWNIEKSDVDTVLESDNHIIIRLTDGRLMAIPKRVLNAQNKPYFEKVLNYFLDIENQNKELGE